MNNSEILIDIDNAHRKLLSRIIDWVSKMQYGYKLPYTGIILTDGVWDIIKNAAISKKYKKSDAHLLNRLTIEYKKYKNGM